MANIVGGGQQCPWYREILIRSSSESFAPHRSKTGP
jgi:hypothetical protein